ncbi:MAG: 2,4-diaminopentanoate dehydrogenase [Verrucomicrobiae bacterium]|nr:2,4-diaminopentanoate dehydrogenase [Verrucomicrobiae bacterium]
MSKPIRVIAYGLGAIGRAAAELVLKKSNMQLVGAVDLNPQYVGQDLGSVLGVGRQLGVKITDKPVVLFAQAQADVVIHCTSSSFVTVYPQLVEIVRAGLHCVTSCEEAMFPRYRNAQLAGELDDLCIKKSCAVVGTGVNPGFVMDTLALALTAACQNLEAVRVLRVVDAATRREALQRKVGVGISEAEFQQLAKDQKIRHVGLSESLVFLADALGWNLAEVDESIAPVIADKRIKTPYFTAQPGSVAGVKQVATGLWNGKEVLRLELQMYAGAANPRDEIVIVGNPPLKLVLDGGTPGDLATPALLVNSLPSLLDARAGLHTMRTLGLPQIAL